MIFGCDLETHPFRRGWMAPRMVCMTLAAPPTWAPLLDALANEVRRVIGSGHALHRSMAVPVLDKPGETREIGAYLFDREAAKLAWRELVESEGDLIFHNASFDLRVLINEMPDLVGIVQDAVHEGYVWDTLIREKLIANSRGQLSRRVDPFTNAMSDARFNLADTVMRYFRIDLREDKDSGVRMQYDELDGVPLSQWPESHVSYALTDAVWPIVVAEAQEITHPPDIAGFDTRACHLHQDSHTTEPYGFLEDGLTRFSSELHRTRADLMLGAGAAWGVRANQDSVARTRKAWETASEASKGIGAELGFVRVAGRDKGKPGSRDVKKLRVMLAEAYGSIPVQIDPAEAQGNPLYSPKGALSYSTDTIRESGHPRLVEYADGLSATSWLTRYLGSLRTAIDGPATYGVDCLKATGRCSIFDPPFHQPPRKGDYRECFEARPGWVYVSCDYAQAELRALAQIYHWWELGDRLRSTFLDGVDPLADMGAQILNARHEPTPNGKSAWTADLINEARKGKHGDEWTERAFDARQAGKAAMYGLPGGLGAPTFVQYARGTYNVHLSLEEAEQIRATWLAVPENRRYLNTISNDIGDRARFTVAQAVTGRIRGGAKYTSAANGYFQGLVADGFLAAGWQVFRETYADRGTALFGCRMVLPLHDEYILEAPEHRAHEAAKRLERVMIDGMGPFIPDVPIEAEAALSRVWSKGAEAITGPDGRLQVWEPS